MYAQKGLVWTNPIHRLGGLGAMLAAGYTVYLALGYEWIETLYGAGPKQYVLVTMAVSAGLVVAGNVIFKAKPRAHAD